MYGVDSYMIVVRLIITFMEKFDSMQTCLVLYTVKVVFIY